eukprot:1815891-Alexandrium_andersonii.AAC.1
MLGSSRSLGRTGCKRLSTGRLPRGLLGGLAREDGVLGVAPDADEVLLLEGLHVRQLRAQHPVEAVLQVAPAGRLA